MNRTSLSLTFDSSHDLICCITKTIYIFALSLFFISCKKDQVDANQCLNETSTSYYLDFWKSEFLKRNSMSATWFDAHISDVRASATCWNSGITFRVNYKVSIDWAVIDDYSDFMVKLYSSESAYQHLAIPRDTLLDAAQLQVILDNEISGSSIGPVKPITTLKYDSYNAAVKAFQDSVKSGVIRPERLAYYVPGNLPRKDGYPYIIGFGTINASLNQCITGHFNLATGASRADTTACVVE